MKKFFKIFGATALGLYLFYFVATALFLNTGIWAKVTGMDDPELTHVIPHGAFSFFPGYLSIAHTLIYISDQNVTIQINVEHAHLRFELLPLFKKNFRITQLVIGDSSVEIGFKTLAQKTAHLEKYTNLKSVNLPLKQVLSNEARSKHVRLEFPHLEIRKLSWVKFPFGTLQGNLSLVGGFMIQPGVEVEVYPTDLFIREAKIENQFENVEATIHTHFDRFFIPDAPGNAIYPFISADMTISALAKNLNFLNLTLRSLPQYDLGDSATPIHGHFIVNHGILSPGSELASDPTTLHLQTSEIDASGNGKLMWKVSDEPQLSTLELGIHHLTLQQRKTRANRGTIQNLALQISLWGTSLTDAFHGLVGKLKLDQLHWTITDKTMQGNVNGNVELMGLSGELPPAVRAREEKKHTAVSLKIDPLIFKTQKFSDIKITGKILASAEPLDFAANRLGFPTIQTDLTVELPKVKNTQVKGSLSEVSYLLAPLDRWKGHLILNVDHTTPVIQLLKAKDSLNSIIAGFAEVSDLQADVDWEKGNDFSWARLNKIKSSGIWNASGSIVQNLTKNEELAFTGAFEVRAGGVPIGIRITPAATQVKLFPSAEWYDQALKQNDHLKTN